jgi:hypothetical protein
MTQVRPENIYVLMYSGGFGGEFLTQLISQHPGFVTAKHKINLANGYHSYYDPPIQVDTNGNNLKAVFPAHPYEDRSKPSKPYDGIIIPPDAVRIAGVCDTRYKRFFFLLFCLKTMLKRMATADVGAEFSEEISHRYRRDWYYQYELDNWRNDKTIPDFREHAQQVYKLGVQGNLANDRRKGKLYYDYSVDIGKLFFEDFESEYANLLDVFGTQAIPEAHAAVADYHARNIALVEYHTGVNYQDLITGTDSQVWEIIYPVLIKFYRLV